MAGKESGWSCQTSLLLLKSPSINLLHITHPVLSLILPVLQIEFALKYFIFRCSCWPWHFSSCSWEISSLLWKWSTRSSRRTKKRLKITDETPTGRFHTQRGQCESHRTELQSAQNCFVYKCLFGEGWRKMLTSPRTRFSSGSETQDFVSRCPIACHVVFAFIYAITAIRG